MKNCILENCIGTVFELNDEFNAHILKIKNSRDRRAFKTTPKFVKPITAGALSQKIEKSATDYR